MWPVAAGTPTVEGVSDELSPMFVHVPPGPMYVPLPKEILLRSFSEKQKAAISLEKTQAAQQQAQRQHRLPQQVPLATEDAVGSGLPTAFAFSGGQDLTAKNFGCTMQQDSKQTPASQLMGTTLQDWDQYPASKHHSSAVKPSFKQSALPQKDDDCDGHLVSTIPHKLLGTDLRKLSQPGMDRENRWWTQSGSPLLCPLTNFPISLLPYPPFKLRVDPCRPSPHKLVDGKFLAMQLIVNNRVHACGRELQAADVNALDEYIHRCKLGPFRPGRALSLFQEALSAGSELEQERAVQELERFRSATRDELRKLRKIQETRLLQISQSGNHEVVASGSPPGYRKKGARPLRL